MITILLLSLPTFSPFFLLSFFFSLYPFLPSLWSISSHSSSDILVTLSRYTITPTSAPPPPNRSSSSSPSHICLMSKEVQTHSVRYSCVQAGKIQCGSGRHINCNRVNPHQSNHSYSIHILCIVDTVGHAHLPCEIWSTLLERFLCRTTHRPSAMPMS